MKNDFVTNQVGEIVKNTQLKWDDRPMYEINRNHVQEDIGYNKSPKIESIDILRERRKSYKSQPSSLYNWFFAEQRKQKAGLENEIDLNEIRAALKGVRNRWYFIVKENYKLIQEMIETKFDWEKIMSLKQVKNNG